MTGPGMEKVNLFVVSETSGCVTAACVPAHRAPWPRASLGRVIHPQGQQDRDSTRHSYLPPRDHYPSQEGQGRALQWTLLITVALLCSAPLQVLHKVGQQGHKAGHQGICHCRTMSPTASDSLRGRVCLCQIESQL